MAYSLPRIFVYAAIVLALIQASNALSEPRVMRIALPERLPLADIFTGPRKPIHSPISTLQAVKRALVSENCYATSPNLEQSCQRVKDEGVSTKYLHSALQDSSTLSSSLSGPPASVSSPSFTKRATGLGLALTSATTNQSLAASLCSQLSGLTTSLAVRNGTTPSETYFSPFLLPECFFNGPVLESVASLAFSGLLIINGNSTYEDPIVRLLKMMPSAQVFTLQTCLLFWANGSRYEGPEDWSTSIFAAAQGLSALTLTQMGLTSTMPTPPLPPFLRSLNLSDNAISGTISPSLFSSITNLPTVTADSSTIDVSNNRITGSLPSTIFTGLPRTIHLYGWFSNNLLEGPLTGRFLTSSNLSSISTLDFKVDRNRLTGSIPSDLFARSSVSGALFYMTLNFSHNSFLGSYPEGLAISPLGTNSLRTLSVSFANTSLSGPISFANILSTITSTAIIDFNLRDNAFNGNLNLSLPISPASFILDASRNRFQSLIFGSSSSNLAIYFKSLDLSDNRNMMGNLSPDLFLNASQLASLNASYTQLSGILPDIALTGGSSLQSLSLDHTSFDFCDSSSSTSRLSWRSSNLSYCSMIGTSALECSSLYPPICNGGTSYAPFSSPSALPCPSPAPSADFYCFEGNWVSNTSISTPTLIIPAGSTTIIVNGNVTSSTIVIEGLGSTIVIYGCFNNLSTVTIRLTPEQLKELSSSTASSPYPLLYYNGTNSSCSDLSQVNIIPELVGSTCRTVKVEKVASNGALSAVFSVNSSRCNLWWIILVSVLSGVVILTALALVIIFQVRRKSDSRRDPFRRVQT